MHFGPLDDHREKQTDPIEDIEYFKWLYDNNLFTSNDVTMEEEDNNQVTHRLREFSMEEEKL